MQIFHRITDRLVALALKSGDLKRQHDSTDVCRNFMTIHPMAVEIFQSVKCEVMD